VTPSGEPSARLPYNCPDLGIIGRIEREAPLGIAIAQKPVVADTTQ